MFIHHFARQNVERARATDKNHSWEQLPYKEQYLEVYETEQEARHALNGTDRDLWHCHDRDDDHHYVLVPHGRVLAPCSNVTGPRIWWKPRLLDNGRGRVEPAHRIERQ